MMIMIYEFKKLDIYLKDFGFNVSLNHHEPKLKSLGSKLQLHNKTSVYWECDTNVELTRNLSGARLLHK